MTTRFEQLRQWENDLIQDRDEVTNALEPLLKRKDDLRQKLELVQSLLNLESHTEISEVQPNSAAEPLNGRVKNAGTGIGSELQNAVREILLESRRSMHVSEIRAALIERGQPIPGRGTDANIIVHLRRAPTVFESKKRGTYGLVESEMKSEAKGGD